MWLTGPCIRGRSSPALGLSIPGARAKVASLRASLFTRIDGVRSKSTVRYSRNLETLVSGESRNAIVDYLGSGTDPRLTGLELDVHALTSSPRISSGTPITAASSTWDELGAAPPLPRCDRVTSFSCPR